MALLTGPEIATVSILEMLMPLVINNSRIETSASYIAINSYEILFGVLPFKNGDLIKAPYSTGSVVTPYCNSHLKCFKVRGVQSEA